jgi:hypothetical protein
MVLDWIEVVMWQWTIHHCNGNVVTPRNKKADHLNRNENENGGKGIEIDGNEAHKSGNGLDGLKIHCMGVI